MERSANATWEGASLGGGGLISTESGVLDRAFYSGSAFFGPEEGTNPEELMAAAYAACYSMSLARHLDGAQWSAERIYTRGTIFFEDLIEGRKITAMLLDVTARIAGIDHVVFGYMANEVRVTSAISKILRIPVALKARLESPMRAVSKDHLVAL